ncbi:hypothetical protein Adi01nite_50280 [Amorphoplanes digitatis]|nr:hypothetical protein GCM10020092_105860 [Actinoplanes digitatis]GID95616.1 hypothetical protein Adi01nite_50280 [Actinoplanes digitatis]
MLVWPGIVSVPSGSGREPASGTAGGATGAAEAGNGLKSMAMAAAVAAEYASGRHHGRGRREPPRPYCQFVNMRSPVRARSPSDAYVLLGSYPNPCTAVDRFQLRGA